MKTPDDAMEFVVAFLAYYDEYGIEDKFNQQTKKMETSWGVKELVDSARKLAPAKLGKIEAANKMREMSDEAREAAIAASGGKVINLRAEFSRKTAENGGTRAMLARLLDNPTADDVKNAQDFLAAERGELFQD